MKGLTPTQLIEITEYVQKHHKFGHVPEKDWLPKVPYGLCIKYIDAIYDSRDATYWSIQFRGMGYIIGFNTNNNYFKQYPSMFDVVMAFLNGELNEYDVDSYIKKFCPPVKTKRKK